MEIEGSFGRRFPLATFERVTLLQESMEEIGPGNRRAGHGGIHTLRGRFDAGFVFARRDSVPTIFIERSEGADVFISFKDEEKTLALYENIKNVLE